MATWGYGYSPRMTGMTHKEFVTSLYRTLLNREADPEGLDNWVGFLESKLNPKYPQYTGSADYEIVKAFRSAAEYAQKNELDATVRRLRDEAYKNQPWGSKNKLTEAEAKAYVQRLYRELLKRDGPEGDVAGHAKNLLSDTITQPQLVNAFINSTEFRRRHPEWARRHDPTSPDPKVRPDVQTYVEDSYRTILDREGESVGVEAHTTGIQGGTAPTTDRQAFRTSDEFATRKPLEGRINRLREEASKEFTGYTGPWPRKYTQEEARAFITRLYTEVLGRPGDPEGLASWATQLADGNISKRRLVDQFVFSEEFRQKNPELYQKLYAKRLNP